MTDEPARRRRSLRLKGYDYTQAGAYFVTVCAQGQACLFGDVIDGCMPLNDAGHMFVRVWNDIPGRFADVEIDTFVVMPNHLRGIIVLPDAATRVVPPLGKVVAAFKSATTVQYIRGVKTRAWPAFQRRLWQRNYYEHVVRDEKALDRIRLYIDENPARWAFDDENPEKVPA
jgi:putative transposase